MALLLRQPRTSQPQQPVGIDWGNPITRGLIEVYNPVTALSSIDNTTYSTTGTVLKVVNRRGQATFAGSGSGAGKTRVFSRLTSAAECSIFASVTPKGAISATQSFGGSGNTSSANPMFLIGSGSTDASQVSFRVRNLAATNQEVTSASGVLVADTPITIAGCRSEAGNFHRVYANGLRLATAAATAIGAVDYNTFAAHGLLRTSFGLQVGSEVNLLMAWNRALSDADIASLSANPWQIFASLSRQVWVPTAVVSISRPTSDITTSGWTGTPDNVTLFNNLDESTSSDTDYISSPTITGGENAIFGISPTLAAGTWDVRYRANFVGSSAQVRIHLLDGSNVSQGTSSWQTVTSSFTDYTASVTTTGTAVRVKVEVQ